MNDGAVCPRCGDRFQCGENGVAPCACSTIALGAELLAELRARFRSCLCLSCLTELAGERKTGPV